MEDPTANLDVLWKTSLLFGSTRPAWSGMMQSVHQRPHQGKSSVMFLPMIDMNPSDVLCVSSTLETLFETLTEKKVSAEEASTADVLHTISECVRRKHDLLVVKSPTAVLWLQYSEMVELLRSFIKAERTAHWELHLNALTRMLPYLAASGHNL